MICIFPEGKVSADGRLRRFRPGIGWFASVTGVPVIPVGIEGAFDSLPKGKKFPRRARITIRAGKPMHYPNPGPDPNRRETFAFVQQVRREVERLTGVPEPATENQEPGDSFILQDQDCCAWRYVVAPSGLWGISHKCG